MPKHRETIFCVVRTAWQRETNEFVWPVICASCMSLERAEELKGKYEQEILESGLSEYFQFRVQTTSYYDE